MNSFEYKNTVLPASNAESHDSTDREPHNTRLTSLQLEAVLEVTNPFCSADEQNEILKALHHETAGSADGLALADDWCSRGNSHPGTEVLTSKWHSFEGCADDQVTIDAIRSRVQSHGFDFDEICRQAENDGEPCDDAVEAAHPQEPVNLSLPENPLDKFSLKGQRSRLLQDVVEQKFVMKPIALMGQATAIFGSPNTGKTLYALTSVAVAISQGNIESSKVYYVNLDDTHSGLLEKLEFAENNGFDMVAEGHNGFSIKRFLEILEELIDTDQAHDIVVIIDTLKKVVDVMSKRQSRAFGKLIRPFVMRGGTCIALAHTNKHKGADGKPIYAGTSDILEDFDCAHLMYEVGVDPDTETKTIQFECIKSRGNVARQASYRYSLAEGLSYREILDSVEPVDQDEVASLKQAAELESDAGVIDAIADCIDEGITTKMALADTAAKQSGVSKRAALRVLDKYCGSDPDRHRWNFKVHERGAMMYFLLNSITAGTDPAE